LEGEDKKSARDTASEVERRETEKTQATFVFFNTTRIHDSNSSEKEKRARQWLQPVIINSRTLENRLEMYFIGLA